MNKKNENELRGFVCYLSGKYRKEFPEKRQFDYIQALLTYREMSLALWEMGFSVFSPHLNLSDIDLQTQSASDLDIENGCLEMLERSDLIYMMPNWVESNRAGREREYALKNGIWVVHDLVELVESFPEELGKIKNLADELRDKDFEKYDFDVDEDKDIDYRDGYDDIDDDDLHGEEWKK